MNYYFIPVNNLNLNQIANSGQCFRWNKVDDNFYVIPYYNTWMSVYQNGNELVVETDASKAIVEYYFDLNTDYGKIIKEIPDDDTFLKEAAAKFSGVRILRQSIWEVVVSFIISQNNNIPKIQKSIEKLCRPTDGVFPQQFQISDINLSECGLGYRQQYIENLVGKNYVPEPGSSYEEALQFYQSFKGIGPKVANCICLYGLHYLEACPIDTWMKRIIRYNGTIPVWMYSKYAGVYQQYCFCYERHLKEANKLILK